MLHFPNSFQCMLVVSPACEMFHKLSTIFLTYNWRCGVTDHPGHLTDGYGFINVCRNVTSVEGEGGGVCGFVINSCGKQARFFK